MNSLDEQVLRMVYGNEEVDNMTEEEKEFWYLVLFADDDN